MSWEVQVALSIKTCFRTSQSKCFAADTLSDGVCCSQGSLCVAAAVTTSGPLVRFPGYSARSMPSRLHVYRPFGALPIAERLSPAGWLSATHHLPVSEGGLLLVATNRNSAFNIVLLV